MSSNPDQEKNSKAKDFQLHRWKFSETDPNYGYKHTLVTTGKITRVKTTTKIPEK